MGGRRFWPLFTAQFCAALGENTLKSALAILVLWLLPPKLAGAGVALAGATLVLPFLFASGFAGRLADRHDRAALARRIKLAELGCTVPAIAGLALGGLWMAGLLYLALLGYGLCAALFGPVKYALLPDHLPPERLPAANAAIETSTFLAILAGTFGGGLNGSALLHAGLLPRLSLAAALVATELVALAAARRIPPAPPAEDAHPRFDHRATLTAHPHLLLALAGGTWFWVAGSIAMALLPVLVRQSFGGDAHASALALGLFALGIGPGAALGALWQRGQVRFGPMLAGTALIGLAMLDLARHVPAVRAHATPLGWSQLLAQPGATGALLDLIALAVAGGLLGAPAASILQQSCPPDRRARMIGFANTLSAAAMVAGALLLAGLQGAGTSAATLFGATGAASVAVAAGGGWAILRRTREKNRDKPTQGCNEAKSVTSL